MTPFFNLPNTCGDNTNKGGRQYANMKIRYLLLLFPFLLFNHAYAQKTDFDKGMAAFNAHDFKTAVTLLSPYAQKSNCTAQFAVGYSYANDYDIKNDSLAIHWLLLAAEQKQQKAMGPLAACYFWNDKVADHLAKAYLWGVLGELYDPKQSPTGTTLMAKEYMKPDELARANKLIDEYEERWHHKPNCQ